MSACRPNPRFVLASSRSVLADTAGDRASVIAFGARKAMVEIAPETAIRRGDLNETVLRSGGMVARRDTNPALKSAFLSQLTCAVKEGTDLKVPVSADACTWASSVKTVAAQFFGALTAYLGPIHGMTLPMTNLCVGDLVDALHAVHPDSPSPISYAPKCNAVKLFGQAQPLHFDDTLAMRACPDVTLPTLVQAALNTGELT